jgi:hypothetical protein
METEISDDPEQVGLLGPAAVVPNANGRAYTIEQARGLLALAR